MKHVDELTSQDLQIKLIAWVKAEIHLNDELQSVVYCCAILAAITNEPIEKILHKWIESQYDWTVENIEIVDGELRFKAVLPKQIDCVKITGQVSI